jgi:hypothetical protein
MSWALSPYDSRYHLLPANIDNGVPLVVARCDHVLFTSVMTHDKPAGPARPKCSLIELRATFHLRPARFLSPGRRLRAMESA